jgi:Acetyltransferases, including N-acetylases of ribosomal proteins
MMNDIILETEHLVLRPFSESDFGAVQSYAGNIENVEYMIWGPNNEEDTKDFIDTTNQEAKKNPRKNYDFAITLKDTKQLIGGGGIYLNDELNQATVGWVLHLDYWKNGYGSEFAAALLKFGFEELNLHRIWATCNTENYGSYRIMERNGMRREAHFIKCRFGRVCDSEVWYDEYHYGILAEEWRERNGGMKN